MVRGLVHLHFAAMWLCVLALRQGLRGSWTGAGVMAGFGLLWATGKGAGMGVVLPEIEHASSWRGLKLIVFSLVLVVAIVKGGLLGIVVYGFLLGLLPSSGPIVVGTVILSMLVNVVLLEGLPAPPAVQYAAASLYVAALLGYILGRQTMTSAASGAPSGAAALNVAWGMLSLPLVLATAYLLTTLVSPSHPLLSDAGPGAHAIEQQGFRLRDLLLWVGALWLCGILWRHMVVMLERRNPKPPGPSAATVFGVQEELGPQRRERGSGKGRGYGRQVIAAFLDLLDILTWHGFPRAPGTTADAHLSHVAETMGCRNAFDEVLGIFNRARYGAGDVTPDDLQRARVLSRSLTDAARKWTDRSDGVGGRRGRPHPQSDAS